MTNSKVWFGVLWKEASFMCFACIYGIMRYLGGGSSIDIDIALGAASMVFFQNLFGTTVMLIPTIKIGLVKSLHTNNFRLQVARAITAVLGILLWALAMKYMPVIQVVALRFSGLIFTVIGAKLFLKEQIDLHRGIAICCCILGTGIITRIDNVFCSTFELVTLLPIASAVCTTASKIFAKKLINAGDTPQTMTTYILLLMVPISFAIALFDWQTPSLVHLPWLALMGLFGAGAHFCFSHAYKLADVTFLMPFKFSKLIFGTAISYFIFVEVPETNELWVGIAVIILSIVFLAKSKHK
ncbi:MAG: hypothetical protein COC15_02640 [Legionellales bacterium]|nr:MAG: hypothetical protein COC15_02640 [Legionellales bacterium]